MRGKKTIVSVILVATLILFWTVGLQSSIRERNQYDQYLTIAQESIEQGLYEQAVENYKLFLSYKKEEDVYRDIMEVYESFYKEDHSAYVRRCYINDMAQAASAFPEKADYWKKQITLYLEEENYAKAYSVAKSAVNSHVKDEELEQLYGNLLYKVQTDFKLYTEFKTCLNGYISVCSTMMEKEFM